MCLEYISNEWESIYNGLRERDNIHTDLVQLLRLNFDDYETLYIERERMILKC